MGIRHRNGASVYLTWIGNLKAGVLLANHGATCLRALCSLQHECTYLGRMLSFVHALSQVQLLEAGHERTSDAFCHGMTDKRMELLEKYGETWP